MGMIVRVSMAILLVWMAVVPVRADVAPASPEELRQRATLIVEGVIEGLRVGGEPSEFEPGIGNTDWGIYLTLRVDGVLKGKAPAGPLVARCFRVRQRRSLVAPNDGFWRTLCALEAGLGITERWGPWAGWVGKAGGL